MIATNAAEIIAARMKGFKPVDMVIVSLVGPVPSIVPIVFAKVGMAYDWRWVRDLDICLYIGAEDDWSTILKDIALQRPEHLNVWSYTEDWGAKVYLVPTAADIVKPVSQWRYELDFLIWMDFQNEDFKACKSYPTR